MIIAGHLRVILLLLDTRAHTITRTHTHTRERAHTHTIAAVHLRVIPVSEFAKGRERSEEWRQRVIKYEKKNKDWGLSR
jgi:hypothetical protein